MKHDLTQGSEQRQLFRMALPMVFGILSIITVNLVDTYFVGQLGTLQLAGMAFTFPVVTILTSLAFGIGTGTSSIVARCIGSGNDESVRHTATHAILLGFLLGLLFAIIGSLTIDPLFRLLGAQEDTLPHIHAYMRIWYAGSFLVVVPMIGNAAIRAAGNTRFPSMIMVLVAVVNLILDPIFIFWLGFGLPGAAIATVIAYSVAFCSSLWLLGVKLKMLDGFELGAIRKSWQSILKIGLPSAASYLISPVSAAVTTWMVAGFGAAAVAGFGVASRIEAISIVVFMALASVTTPFVGQNWGAGRKDRVRNAIRSSYKFTFFWGIGVAIVMWLFADGMLTAFNPDLRVVGAAANYLHIVPVTYTLLGVVMVAANVGNGIGNPYPGLIMTLARLMVLYLPLAYLLQLWIGLTGVFWATATCNAVVGLGALIWSTQRCKVDQKEALD